MTPDDDADPDPPSEDRPQDADAQSAVDPKDRRKRQDKVKRALLEDAAFLRGVLEDPVGRRFLWGILKAAGTFEDKYGFGPYGAVNDAANAKFKAEHDFGLRLYHSWSILDRAGMLGLMDEFHPSFPKVTNG